MSDLIQVNNNIKTLIQSGCRPSYKAEIESFLSFAGKELNLEKVQDYIESLKDSGKKAATVNKHIAALKNMLRTLFSDPNLTVLQKYQLERALSDIKLIKEGPNKNAVEQNQVLSPDEIELLKYRSPKRSALLVEFLYQTGCRISEALNIELRDLILSDKYYKIEVIGKGNKARTIKGSVELIDKIVDCFDGKTYLFESRSGNPLDRHNVFKELRRLGLKHLGRKIHPHMLRHSFATKMIKRTGKIKGVSAYLGHSTTAITMDIYVSEILEVEELFV